jgi:UDP-N-acetylglucosamine--N-acetylmuramyl-(pentapeptide) pyrophosphoryl-undecaprenol N-acetylglucosamine transferase
MTIVVTGGGSGGHITPILAVAAELKKIDSSLKVVYIGQKGDSLSDIPAANPHIDAVYAVRAGKFRRYHGEGWRQLFDLKTQLLNLRDSLYVIIGLIQSYRLMRRLKPAIVFSRGGFVSVPVALGGKLSGVPYITHDSDSTPSFANRIIARWARLHAVALPIDTYPYPPEKTRQTGVPVSTNFEPVSARLMRHYRTLLGLRDAEQVLMVGGAGNGAQRLNEAVINNAAYLLQKYPKLYILHITGRTLEERCNKLYDQALTTEQRMRIVVEGFTTDLYRYSGAADIVIGRAGATTLAEFAIQGKACIIIPAGQLVGNHQTKNARALADRGAIMMLDEDQAEQERRLASLISDLLDDEGARRRLGENFAKLAHPSSAHELATLILEQAGTQSAQSNSSAPSS